MPERRPNCAAECEYCLKPMRKRMGKRFCCDQCRLAWHNSPRAAGKLRKQIEGIVLGILRERGLIDA